MLDAQNEAIFILAKKNTGSPEDRRASCGRRSRSLSAGGNQAGSHPSTLQRRHDAGL
jgi:hypothetical protein